MSACAGRYPRTLHLSADTILSGFGQCCREASCSPMAFRSERCRYSGSSVQQLWNKYIAVTFRYQEKEAAPQLELHIHALWSLLICTLHAFGV